MIDEVKTKKNSSARVTKTHRGPEKRVRNARKGKRRRERVRPEFEHRVIDVRRVARVMAGGRRFSFSVVVAAGDRKGRVGVGIGKAGDTASAIDKALRHAKNNMLTLKLTKEHSIPHEVEAKYASAVVRVFPSLGKGGITAGGAVRSVLELSGVRSVGAKILSRSKNKLNNARATIAALKQLKASTVKQHTRKTKKEKTDTTPL